MPVACSVKGPGFVTRVDNNCQELTGFGVVAKQPVRGRELQRGIQDFARFCDNSQAVPAPAYVAVRLPVINVSSMWMMLDLIEIQL